MGVLMRDKGCHFVAGERGEREIPVEDEAGSIVVGDPAQCAMAKAFEAKGPYEIRRPGRVLIHVDDNLLVQGLASRNEHELMAPHFENFSALGLAAE
jgi:hypothetical protein